MGETSPVRSVEDLGRVACHLPDPTDALEAGLAQANRSAWERSATRLTELLGGYDIRRAAGRSRLETERHATDPERLRALLTPVQLDDIIADHVVPTDVDATPSWYPRLSRDGQPMALDSYIHADAVASEGRGAHLDAYALNAALRAGAALYLTALHEQHRPAALLVEDLRRVLGGRGGCGAFLSHGPGPSPFGLHWDTTENFCLQIEGRRHWEVRAPDIADNHPGFALGQGNPGEVVWEGETGPGDILVIPRAYWHDVRPVGDGLSLHLTAGITRPVGHDALSWMLAVGGTDAALRAPLAHPEAAAGTEPSPADLLAPVTVAADAGLAAHLQAREVPLATPGARLLELLELNEPGDLFVRRQLTGLVTVADEAADHGLVLAAGGRLLTLDHDVLTVVARLLAGPPVRLADVFSAASPQTVVALVDVLLRVGWLTTVGLDET